jgi:hypothetical protein
VTKGLGRGSPGKSRDPCSEVQSLCFGLFERAGYRIGRGDPRRQGPGSSGIFRELRKGCKIGHAAFGMHIQHALGELRHLRDTAGDRHPLDRMAAQIFEHTADKISHIDQGDLPQAVIGCHGLLGRIAGRACNMGKSCSTGDIDASPDRMDPCRAGEWNDDSGRAEDGDPAEDTEPRVQGFFRQQFTTGDGDLHLQICHGSRHFSDRRGNHLPGNWIDGGLPDRQRQACPRYRAHSLAGSEGDARTGAPFSYRADDKGAVGDVRVIARILDHAGSSKPFFALFHGKRKGRPLPSRQRHLDEPRKLAPKQRLTGSLAGRSRTGSRRPAAAQVLAFDIHDRFYNWAGRDRHRQKVSA